MGQPMEQLDDDKSTTVSNKSAMRQPSYSPASYSPVYQPMSSAYQPSGNTWSSRSPVYSSPNDPGDPFIVPPTSDPNTIPPSNRPSSPVYDRETGDDDRTYGASAPTSQPTSPAHASEAPRRGPNNQSDNDPFVRLFRPDSPAFEPDSPDLVFTTPPSGRLPVRPASPRHGSASSSNTTSTEIERRGLRLRAYDALIAINSLNRLHPDGLAPRPERLINVGDVQLPESAVIDAAIAYTRGIRQDALVEAAR